MNDMIQSTVIGGRKYTLQKLAGSKSISTFNKLVASVGPGLVTTLRGLDLSKGLSGLLESDHSKLFEALERGLPALIAGLPEDVFEDLKERLLSTVEVLLEKNGKKTRGMVLEHFDELFQGRVFDFYKLIIWSVRANYGSFSKDGKSGLEAITNAMSPAPTESPSDSVES